MVTSQVERSSQVHNLFSGDASIFYVCYESILHREKYKPSFFGFSLCLTSSIHSKGKEVHFYPNFMQTIYGLIRIDNTTSNEIFFIVIYSTQTINWTFELIYRSYDIKQEKPFQIFDGNQKFFHRIGLKYDDHLLIPIKIGEYSGNIEFHSNTTIFRTGNL